ncbi:unnamed protein product [Clonostachys rosea f. rosea IK726]|uniref:Stress-activated map kinase-interacting protein 1 n=2 Tax=Bionectria ochroleuca TaxID=29856 RepID=A0A0B7K129_BIOOC|nr:unnamed protein product [Clonostachys rosea f. rosea IK726]
MSVIQLDELVLYQLRTSYLNEITDGVGERLLTVNEGFVNSAAFKAAGWRPNSSHIKRTHSPPIPTAIASEYFQASRNQGYTLEDGEEDGGMLTGGGADTVGPSMAATRRRRRREQEEVDSSDLSDESDDETDQRAAQQIKFAKMPVRNRSGSSPTQASNMKTAQSPRSRRRGSQSALEVVKERARRDTVTSSEISSDNEIDTPQKQQSRGATRAVARAARFQDKIQEEPPAGLRMAGTTLDEDDDDDSDDGSDLSDNYVGSIDSVTILDVAEVPVPINASPTQQVVGTPPKNLTRQSTVRKSRPPVKVMLEALPPPRPMSTIRPPSMAQPRSLLSAALKAKEHKSVPFQKFAHYNGQGTQGSIAVRIYPAFSKKPGKPFELLIQPRVHDGQGTERPVTVADLIGLSLYRYNTDKKEPPLPSDKLNINWWTLRMVEDGEVDDDFPPFERTKALNSFTTVNNANQRGGGRGRSNSTAYDEFALVEASKDEYEDNKELTPQEETEERPAQEEAPEPAIPEEPVQKPGSLAHSSSNNHLSAEQYRPRQNPIITTTYRTNTPLADMPQAPASTNSTARGPRKLLRISIMSSDVAPGQMVTVDVTTDTYLVQVLETVCTKRQLEKANHVLKLPGSGVVVMLDRPVSSIGNVSDLELHRRRFATDGPLTMSGSPGSTSPKAALAEVYGQKKSKKTQMLGPHPLAREIAKQDELRSATYKKYTVWRKQPMRIVGMSERILVIDGEYIHIVPASGGKALRDGGGKTTTVHFRSVVGCKVLRKHPTNVQASLMLIIYKTTELKRYDFETRGVDEAAEIVTELKRGVALYHDI